MKTILITGATDGIGRETARQLLSQGHRVLLHGRNLDKAQNTVKELNTEETLSVASAEPVYGDLADMQQVLRLAEQVKQKTEVLDVLIHNAGVFEQMRRLNADGFELTMVVNHFAPFLLTHNLQENVQASAQGRFVVVSSIAHGNGRLDLDDLNLARNYSGYGAYAASKLANVLFTAALARRLQGSTATANCLHPGVINTKLLHSGFGISGASVAKGARTSVYLATADEVSAVNGQYFVDCRVVKPSATAQAQDFAEAFWRASETALKAYLS